MKRNCTSQIIHRGQQGRSLDHYKREKVFPHITDQYDFRINNKLLIAKIINPRRDKIIMDSLINASPKFTLKKKKIDQPDTSCCKRRSNIRQYRLRKNRKSKTEQTLGHLNCPQTNFNQLNKLKTIKAETIQDDSEREEHNQNRTIFIFKEVKNSGTQINSVRNNFVGKIIKNTCIDQKNSNSSRLPNNFTMFSYDMNVSYHMKKGLIKRNIKENISQKKKSDKFCRGNAQDSYISKKKDCFLRENHNVFCANEEKTVY